VQAYAEEAARKSERSRAAEQDKKTGCFTGAYSRNPASGERIPIWIADYVLAGYGTGAIMAVPGHDERDWAFARTFGLPVVEVVAGGEVEREPFVADGEAVRSGFLDGLPTPRAKERMIEWLEAEGKGERAVQYKLRDWLFSRQRYWGEPLPVLHLEDGSVKLVPDAELPLLLPELDDYKPTGDFGTPLERARGWIETRDPATGRPARREPNTMPNWAGSCWYFLRFCDPHNDREPWSLEAERYWMPVDLYVGGAEHAVLHLLYARFWHKVFYDLGLVHTKESFQKLLNPGLILGVSYRYYDDNATDDPAASPRRFPASAVRIEGERAVAVATGAEVKARWLDASRVRRSEGGAPVHPDDPDLVLEEVTERMSKSRGNVVSPDDVVARYGADALRLYELFMGPLEKGAPWSEEGIPGVFRFLQRVWRLLLDEDAAGEPARPLAAGEGTPEQARLTARTIAGVTADLDALQPNTAIAKLMVWARDVAKDAPVPRAGAEAFLRLLSPFAPHLAEELWARLGCASPVSLAPWPEADPALLVDATIRVVVQVNGKKRDDVEVPAGADEAALRAAALASGRVRALLQGREPKSVVVVPGRLVNVVV
jgi:leucyl-tRNA synthetase